MELARLEGEEYVRQNLIQGIKVPKTATVVGCGGTGFWTGLFLGMSGVEHLILVDSDIVEMSNAGRLLVHSNHSGHYKVEVLQGLLRTYRPRARVELHALKITCEDECAICRGSVFCCTDNIRSQQLLNAYCKKNYLPYQRIGYDGTLLNVSNAFPLQFEDLTGVPDEDVREGYTVAPSWIIPAVLAAAAGVSSQLWKKVCLMDDIGKLMSGEYSAVPDGLADKWRDEGYDDGKNDGAKEREDYIRGNIDGYIPDDYGYCGDCDRVDPDYVRDNIDEFLPSDYGYCGNCDRMDYDEFVDAVVENIKSGRLDSDIKDAIADNMCADDFDFCDNCEKIEEEKDDDKE